MTQKFITVIMLDKIIKIWKEIYEHFPDLVEDPESIQYQWAQELRDMIDYELALTFSTPQDLRKYLSSCQLTQNQIGMFIKTWSNS